MNEKTYIWKTGFINKKLYCSESEENASVLILPVNIMLVATVMKHVGYCQSGKGFLLHRNTFQE